MKLCVLGGGGSRAILLAKSLLQDAPSLGINEIVFMDTNKDSLRVFGGMVLQAASLVAPKLNVSITTDPLIAVTNADFIITTIRAGGDRERVMTERIPLALGLLGQETTGAGGFFMALATIPTLASYCDLIRRYGKKNAMVFNFSNPSGLVTQAMWDLGHEFVYGICDAPSGFLRQIAKLRQQPLKRMKMDAFGLNHLSYFTSITENDKDITLELLEDPRLFTETDMRYFEPELPRHFGLLLNEYLYYFYYREQAIENILQHGSTRGEEILKTNESMYGELSNYDPATQFDKMMNIYARYNHSREISYMSAESSVQRSEAAAPIFDFYSKDEGGYAGVALALIRAKQTGAKGEMVLNVPNGKTALWLSEVDIVETTCTIGAHGAIPKSGMKELPDSGKALVQAVKCYERLAVKAIRNKSMSLAAEALMVHPLVNSYSLATVLLSEYRILNPNRMEGWTT
jgi:6-phospho-beta-glucosidase